MGVFPVEEEALSVQAGHGDPLASLGRGEGEVSGAVAEKGFGHFG